MGWDDINPVQALLMFNIGDAELTAGELRSRGYYLGSNVSYNLKKLVETGYIFQERSRTDRRSVRIRLTPKGEEVAEVIDELYDRHLKSIDKVVVWATRNSTASTRLSPASSASGSTRSSTSSSPHVGPSRYGVARVASLPQPHRNTGPRAGVFLFVPQIERSALPVVLCHFPLNRCSRDESQGVDSRCRPAAQSGIGGIERWSLGLGKCG